MIVRDEEDGRPPRPYLPPLLVAGLALWVVSALLWPALRIVPAGALFPAGGLALALAALLGVRALRAARSGDVALLHLVAIAVLGAVAMCSFAAGAQRSAMASIEEGGGAAGGLMHIELREDARKGDFGWSVEALARSESGRCLRVRLNMPEGALMLKGEVVTAEGELAPPSEASADYYWNEGLAGSLTLDESALSGEGAQHSGGPLVDLRRRALGLIEAHGGSRAPLLQALVCGWRPGIEESGLYERFKTVGLAHLVAVSGAHLSIVAMFAAAGLRLLRLGRRAATAAGALFLAGYVAFAGMPVSALRAAVMAATGMFSLLTDRRNSALSALGLCLLGFVGMDPACALSASFALSAGSTLGIILFAPLISSAFSGRRLKRALGDPIALTCSSALATQPYAAALFSQLPLLSPVANLVAGPLFTLACLVGFVAVLLACLIPAAAPWLVGAASLACAPLSIAVDALASVPGTCAPVDADPVAMAAISFIACGMLWAWWPRASIGGLAKAGAAAALALAALPIPFGLPGEAIVMLDVGQGDAFLVRSGERTLLIDTGNQDALLKAALARQRVAGLDAVAITHSDDDHCGSLPALREVAPASSLLVAEDLPRCSCAACAGLMREAASEGMQDDIVALSPGDEVRCGRFLLTVLWPDRYSDQGGNADSLCLLCAWDGDGDGDAEWTSLFTGDAGIEQMEEISQGLPAGGVDVLKVPHHGSKSGLNADVAERLSPAVALIGVGEANRYGHPSREVLDALWAAGAAVFRSDQSGDVTVAFSEDKLTVSTQRP